MEATSRALAFPGQHKTLVGLNFHFDPNYWQYWTAATHTTTGGPWWLCSSWWPSEEASVHEYRQLQEHWPSRANTRRWSVLSNFHFDSYYWHYWSAATTQVLGKRKDRGDDAQADDLRKRRRCSIDTLDGLTVCQQATILLILFHDHTFVIDCKGRRSRPAYGAYHRHRLSHTLRFS